MRNWLLIIMCFPVMVMAQDDEPDQEKEEVPKLTINGYVKDMVTMNMAGKDSVLWDNLIHHRLNVAWYPSEKITGKIEFRNRIFFGDRVSSLPNYGMLVDQNNDYFDLSWIPINTSDFVIHSMIDRAYLQYNKDQWEITLGRQRINWGMTMVWNSNDLFNNYSFFDFDYEERLGSDALRIRKYTGFASEMELAVKAADRFEDFTSAFKYQVNRWNYDMQFITGVMKNNLAVGAGWAGNIKSAGFKGEMTYLHHLDTKEDGFQVSMSVDYSFPSSLYLNGSVFYNSYGQAHPDFFLVNTSSNLDIRSLSPYTWSVFVQGMLPVHPLVNIGLSGMLFPSDGSVFINPYVTISILSNLDLDIISQLFLADDPQDHYGIAAKVFYFRLKWSY